MGTGLHFRSTAWQLLFGACLLFTVSSCSPRLGLTGTSQELYNIGPDKPVDSAMLAFYRPYKVRLDSMMNEVIAISEVEITKAKPEGTLNNLMADAMYQIAKANNVVFDFAVTNYGGLRLPLPKGNIPLYKVFELMPFENALTTVKLSGADTRALFDYMAANGGDPISGATYKIRDKRAVDIRINGEPLREDRSYTVLTSDYLANGGDNAVVFERSFGRIEHPIKLRDVLVTYLKQQSAAGKTINPKIDGRVTVE